MMEIIADFYIGIFSNPWPDNFLGCFIVACFVIATPLVSLVALFHCFQVVALLASLILALLGKPEPLFFLVKAWALRR